MMIIFKKRAAWLLAMLLFFVFTTQAIAINYPLVTSLNGAWQRQYLKSFSADALSSSGWKEVYIPAMESNPAGHFAAYRKVFVNPAMSR